MCWNSAKWQSLVRVKCVPQLLRLYAFYIVPHTAYFNDLVVGAVCCRVEMEGDKHRMYIMTLGCLAPYRRLGVGTKSLSFISSLDLLMRCNVNSLL